ncbi:hypothetical protein AB5I41_16875 [Sphingomonas sp. MMS24-JH45]
MTGESEGGHLAAMVALAHDDPAFEPSRGRRLLGTGRGAALRPLRHARPRAALGAQSRCPDQIRDPVGPMPGPPRRLLERGQPDRPYPLRRATDAGDPRHRRRPVAARRGQAEAFAAAIGARHVALPGIEHAYDIAASAATWVMSAR